MICCFCNKKISELESNNAAPVLYGICCEKCNVYVVKIRILLTKLGVNWRNIMLIN
jgi:hypothetical protein